MGSLIPPLVHVHTMVCSFCCRKLLRSSMAFLWMFGIECCISSWITWSSMVSGSSPTTYHKVTKINKVVIVHPPTIKSQKLTKQGGHSPTTYHKVTQINSGHSPTTYHKITKMNKVFTVQPPTTVTKINKVVTVQPSTIKSRNINKAFTVQPPTTKSQKLTK